MFVFTLHVLDAFVFSFVLCILVHRHYHSCSHCRSHSRSHCNYYFVVALRMCRMRTHAYACVCTHVCVHARMCRMHTRTHACTCMRTRACMACTHGGHIVPGRLIVVVLVSVLRDAMPVGLDDLGCSFLTRLLCPSGFLGCRARAALSQANVDMSYLTRLFYEHERDCSPDFRRALGGTVAAPVASLLWMRHPPCAHWSERAQSPGTPQSAAGTSDPEALRRRVGGLSHHCADLLAETGTNSLL